MTSRKWVRLFLKTLFLGGLSGVLVSFFAKSDTYAKALEPFSIFEVLGLIFMFLGLGFIFSVISQMGFFAYLTVHQFGLGMFRGVWPFVQVVLIAFTLFDFVYFRYKEADGDVALWTFFVIPIALLIYGLAVSYVKAKETNQKAFIPALFFMVVITSVEWIPAIRANDPSWMMLMLVPLLVCNTYQLLVLHRITGESQNKTEAADTTNQKKPSGNAKSKKKKKKKKKK
ncbi:KinB-signaling pathway activation protein [Pontibacillus sp. HMF3514]|uniref:KinB-signaling pathway activation protein n=1 Tax=Pontibacillus sp. HMF3514 TaxID=2692425 RepID=UPI00131FF495|nr:KinB-signaling pathway activation protein [Pontibacillus sp. HMF3514]QHE50728.1 KinB-signaling pathway activation protein [Pontibacillus sp. HMF3514]